VYTTAALTIATALWGSPEAIVLTHPHADHYAGILELIDDYPEAALGSFTLKMLPPRPIAGRSRTGSGPASQANL